MDTMNDTKMQPATDAVIEEQFLELTVNTVMTAAEVAAKLRQFNEWRRGDYEPSEQPEPPNPYEVGLAIDAAVEMIERAESDLATAEQDSRQKQARIERLEGALRLIADTDPVDAALDPQRAIRAARAALEESK